MRDGPQHGRLELVAPAQRRGLHNLRLQLGAVPRRRQQRLQRGHHAVGDARALVVGEHGRHRERADAPLLGREREPQGVLRRVLIAEHDRRRVHADGTRESLRG